MPILIPKEPRLVAVKDNQTGLFATPSTGHDDQCGPDRDIRLLL